MGVILGTEITKRSGFEELATEEEVGGGDITLNEWLVMDIYLTVHVSTIF